MQLHGISHAKTTAMLRAAWREGRRRVLYIYKGARAEWVGGFCIRGWPAELLQIILPFSSHLSHSFRAAALLRACDPLTTRLSCELLSDPVCPPNTHVQPRGEKLNRQSICSSLARESTWFSLILLNTPRTVRYYYPTQLAISPISF